MLKARLLQYADFTALMRLYIHLDAENAQIKVDDRMEAIWSQLCNSENHLYYGADADGELVASCTATIVPNLTNDGRPYAVIENVVTHKAYRRQGYGRIVVKAAIDKCKQVGCYKIMLMSGYKRGLAHEFYKSLGFDKSAKQAFVIYVE